MGIGRRWEPLEAVAVDLGGEGFPKGRLVIALYLIDLLAKLPSDLGLKALNGRADIVLTLGRDNLCVGR